MSLAPEQLARQRFLDRFGRTPEGVAVAPGRVNLIGDHTDYNDGFVLPMAIDRSLAIAFSRRGDTMIELTSDLGDATFDLDPLAHGEPSWSEYVRGVASTLPVGTQRHGWDGAIASDIPAGAGLSSSAALEIASALVFEHVGRGSTSTMDIVRASQRAEREWVGMECGIMDQMSVAMSRSGHALLIDCRTLEHTMVPVPDTIVFVILDTSTRRELVTSAYNERRAACERVARHLGVAALRDVDADGLAAAGVGVDPIDLLRARHVVSENARVLEAARALEAGDGERLGSLMDDSHTSLRDDFASSSDALDAIVEAARLAPGCLGARVTGAGFAGCAVAAVRAEHVDRFIPHTAERFKDDTGLIADLHPCRPGDGATLRLAEQPPS